MISLFNLGFSQRKIALIEGLNKKYISSRKRIMISQGYLTEEGILSARENMEKEANRRRKAITDQNVDLSIVNLHMEYAKAMFKLGDISKKDIELLSSAIQRAPELMLPRNINLIITYYTREGKSAKAMEFIQKCIDGSGDDKEKKSKLEVARDNILDKMAKEQIRKSIKKVGNPEVVEARRKAIMAMINLDKVLSITSFNNQMKYVTAKLTLGELEEVDMDLLRGLIEVHPKLVDEQNVRFIVDYLVSQDRTDEASRFVSECRSLVEDEGGQRIIMLDDVIGEIRGYRQNIRAQSEFRKRLEVNLQEKIIIAIPSINYINKARIGSESYEK